MGRLQSEIGPAVDDLPASRLDLRAESVRLGPVAGDSSCRPRMGEAQDGIGYSRSRHPVEG